jgi:hypothetical protein
MTHEETVTAINRSVVLLRTLRDVLREFNQTQSVLRPVLANGGYDNETGESKLALEILGAEGCEEVFRLSVEIELLLSEMR